MVPVAQATPHFGDDGIHNHEEVIGAQAAGDGFEDEKILSAPERNKRYRRRAVMWMSKQPWPIVALAAHALQPLADFVSSLLDVSSFNFGIRESTRVLLPTLSTHATTTPRRPGELGGRSWPLLLAAERALENRALEPIKAAHEVKRYIGYPAYGCTVGMRALMYKMLSRQAASIYMNRWKCNGAASHGCCSQWRRTRPWRCESSRLATLPKTHGHSRLLHTTPQT